MSKLLGCVMLVLTAGAACGEANGAGKGGVGSGGGGSTGAAGRASVAGSSGSPAAGGGNAAGDGGKVSVSGAGGQAISGGSGDESGGAGSGGGEVGAAGEGGAAVDARPGCDEAALIELSHLRLVEGAGPGETAVLEVEATNGSSDFVSYNPVKISCTGDAVAQARDRLVFFGINQGEASTVTLEVDFEENAQAGDVAHCTVRGAILGKSPDDCANAQTLRLDVTVK